MSFMMKNRRKIIYTRGGFGVAKVSKWAIKKNLKALIKILKQSKEKRND